MNKKYILDTNVLLKNGKLFEEERFQDGDIYIPMVVIAELDYIKSDKKESNSNLKFKAKTASRSIEEGVEKGLIKLLRSNDELKEKSFNTYEVMDDLILSTAMSLKNKDDSNIIIVSNDLNVRLKAKGLGLDTEEYDKNSLNMGISEMYSGVLETETTRDNIDTFYKNGYIEWNKITESIPYPNQFLIASDNQGSKGKIVAIFRNGHFEKLKYGENKFYGKHQAKDIYQKFALELLYDENIKIVTISGAQGCGKAQPLHSKLLKEDGWVSMGSIKVGDMIYGRDGELTTVTNIYPQGIKSNYKIEFWDGRIVECCDEHLWNISSDELKSKSKEQILTLREIIDKFDFETDAPKNVWIRNTKPVKHSEKNFEIDPYLLGVLVSIKPSEKFIPDIYMLGSVDQRYNLLKGLIDTDGHVDKEGRISYSTTSKTLLKNVIDLANSLGIIATTYTDSECFKIIFRTNDIIFSTDKHRVNYNYRDESKHVKIKSIEYIGEQEMQCISVDNKDSMYLTDGYIPTHNTFITAGALLEQVQEKSGYYNKLIIGKDTTPINKWAYQGFVPGEIEDKLLSHFNNYLTTFENLADVKELDGKNHYENFKSQNLIDLLDVSSILGSSFNKKAIIIDEFQGCDLRTARSCLTRISDSCKLVLCGDILQQTVTNLGKEDSALFASIEWLKEVEGVGHITLKGIHRGKIVEDVAKCFDQNMYG